MAEPVPEDLVAARAPVDVQDTVAWLLAQDYVLADHRGQGSMGAYFVFVGEAEVRITVDRSQWFLDVAARPGREPWQYDLLVAAHSAQDYGQRFPETGPLSPLLPLPEQMPPGVSWRQTLPDLLAWIGGNDVGAAVDAAREQRRALMWRKPGQ